MNLEPKPHLTPEEYLAFERAAEEKSEYLEGEMFAMVGASWAHNLIVVNLGRELSLQLRDRPCETYGSDQRILVEDTGLYTYADTSVVCEKPVFLADAYLDTLLNPLVLIEVLSSSTEAYDRGQKFRHYRSIPSLREYLMVSQQEPLIEHYLRQPGGTWLFTATRGLDAVLDLPALGVRLALAEVYAKVQFE